ncbi:MAG: IPExxxVDY family protein [Bacteroidales bacterium]
MVTKLTIPAQGYDSAEVLVLGMQAPLLPIHKLAFLLNRELDFTLCKKSDFTFYYDGNQQATFDFYTFPDLENHVSFYLLSNKSQFYLLPKFASSDFFLFAQGSIDRLDAPKIIEKIENIESIFSVANIPLDKIKFLDLLLSDLEEHLDRIRIEETPSVDKLREGLNKIEL